MTAPTCRTCRYHVPLCNGSGYLNCAGPHLVRPSVAYGQRQGISTVERERSALWRWLGFNTCGPTGRFWEEEPPRQPPPPYLRPGDRLLSKPGDA